MRVSVPTIKCSVCDVLYVLRVAHVFGADEARTEWMYQRDCKHKSGTPIQSDAYPLVVPDTVPQS